MKWRYTCSQEPFEHRYLIDGFARVAGVWLSPRGRYFSLMLSRTCSASAEPPSFCPWRASLQRVYIILTRSADYRDGHSPSCLRTLRWFLEAQTRGEYFTIYAIAENASVDNDEWRSRVTFWITEKNVLPR